MMTTTGGPGQVREPGVGLRERAKRLVASHTTAKQRALMLTWASFGTTFGTARLITHGIRGGWLPVGNVSAGGKHLHHYNLGIGILAGIGLIATQGDKKLVGHPALACAYGVGAALIADEFALLLDLEDVYWAEEGRVSVDLSLSVLSGIGIYLTALPFWHELARVTHHHVRGHLDE